MNEAVDEEPSFQGEKIVTEGRNFAGVTFN